MVDGCDVFRCVRQIDLKVLYHYVGEEVAQLDRLGKSLPVHVACAGSFVQPPLDSAGWTGEACGLEDFRMQGYPRTEDSENWGGAIKLMSAGAGEGGKGKTRKVRV